MKAVASHDSAPVALRSLRVGFLMSTEVGLKTQYLHWRHGLTPDLGIEPEWIVISWWRHDALLERLPLVPHSLKARARAALELRAGLSRGPFDALFIGAGDVSHGKPSLLKRQPYFLTSDVTTRLLHAFGDLYGKRPSRLGFVEARKHAARCERLRNARALFPWSHWAAGSMIEDYGADPRRVHVIPPGVDVEQWRCPARHEEGPTHILFVGGDFYRKGGDLLLEWARRTRAKDWVLHLVTRDPVRPGAPNVKVYNGLTPNDTALMALYRQAHLFALPTRGDCYSIASIEAMAAGLPVILSETGGTGDIIRDGETGYLIAPGDGAALAERLEHLLAHPDRRRRMGEAARADAEARYDSRQNVRRTVEIMRAALEQ